jgi:hypothetical protein
MRGRALAMAGPKEAEVFSQNIMTTYSRYPITMVKYVTTGIPRARPRHMPIGPIYADLI